MSRNEIMQGGKMIAFMILLGVAFGLIVGYVLGAEDDM